MAAVYLIHFDQPYKHARHYVGYTSWSVKRRCAHHADGTGARLMQVVTEAGITWRVVRIWRGQGRTWERQIKNYGHTAKLCPVCSGRKAHRLMRGPTPRAVAPTESGEA